MSFEDRVKFLKAPSVFHLCKTIIMENTKYSIGIESFPNVKDDPTYPKYVIVIVQFEGKISSQRILNIMKKY